MTAPITRRNRGTVLNLMCHGDPDRCYKVKGRPLPLCARCITFYPLFMVTALVSIPLFLLMNVKAVAMTIVFILLVIPLVLDGVTQYLGLRRSNNPLRSVTGALAGTGCGLALGYLATRLFL